MTYRRKSADRRQYKRVANEIPEEGVVLMCLAEALLRIPDAATQDRMIQDRLGTGDWSARLGHSDSLDVNASARGCFSLAGRFVSLRNRMRKRGAEKSVLVEGD